MKFTISRDDLLHPLQRVASVTERRPKAASIFSNLLLSVEGQSLSLTTTDHETQLVCKVALPPEEVVADGSTTIPAHVLLDMCRALPEGAALKFSQEPDERVLLKSSNSKVHLATLPATDFVKIGEDEEGLLQISLPQSQLLDLINKVSFSMAVQDIRHYLNGLLLEVSDEHIRTVATNGHRLAMHTVTPGAGKETRQIIIPGKGVKELQGLLDESDGQITLSLGQNFLQVVSDNFAFTTQLVDGKFPDYQKVIPTKTDQVLLADKKMLMEGLRRSAVITAGDALRVVRLSLKADKLRVHSASSVFGEAEEILDAKFSGDDLEIGFNVVYLINVLEVLEGEQVSLGFSEANQSALLKGDESSAAQYVVMPVRL